MNSPPPQTQPQPSLPKGVKQSQLRQPQLKSLRQAWLNNYSFQAKQTPGFVTPAIIQELVNFCDQPPAHGLLDRWLDGIDQFHQAVSQQDYTIQTVCSESAVGLKLDGKDQRLSATTIVLRQQMLKSLCPWRKGPFHFFGQTLDAEWRSNLKYDRLKRFGPTVEDKTLLDIGSGNGYYGYRLLADGARYIMGVDPSQLFWCQSLIMKRFMPDLPIDILPIAGEPLGNLSPNKHFSFDCVLSMGVLYHRKAPIDHLKLMKQLVNRDGQIVLETLVLNGAKDQILCPQDTYAGMANVYTIPSIGVLTSWLEQAGFTQIECVSLAYTGLNEQRLTEWIATHSLEDFLSADQQRTKEGYQLPWRAMLTAKRKD